MKDAKSVKDWTIIFVSTEQVSSLVEWAASEGVPLRLATWPDGDIRVEIPTSACQSKSYADYHRSACAASTRARSLIDKLRTAPSAPDDLLDELVHSAKSLEASSINNQGFDHQIHYLLGKGLADEAEHVIDQRVDIDRRVSAIVSKVALDFLDEQGDEELTREWCSHPYHELILRDELETGIDFEEFYNRVAEELCSLR